MRWKNWLPLIVALVFGLVAAKVARDMIVRGGTSAGTGTGGMTSVVVAKVDIAPGTELTEDVLTMSQVSASPAPRRSFSAVSELVGSVTQIEIPRGTEIVTPMLAAGGSGTGLQALVPPGMRAISIEVNEFSGVGGMLVPGSRVDVLVTLPSKEAGGEPISRTIVQNVKVTAVGQQLARGDGKIDDHFKSVTLVTTPEQAEAIELATTNGRPRLVLRSGRDNAARASGGVRLGELRGNFEPVAVAQVYPIRDPFATVPIVTAPATQPVTPQVADPGTAVARRSTVQLILGGVESTVIVDDGSVAVEAYSGATIEP